ncbi:hypothetical protein CROQUDRAFT_92682 [Cronartium quercuum f. sp. fusiforme G11]|uniref:Uncharacterized protein n=1 Tax=Cronartium quercuum f. sp. fusiforme G11 TaxID=708437 RepID=A0A9P6NLM1_9BASI|nr:hypothetical protein CROQUDRAFT_92682 [Cronartium quercuum f. sp. fusiforme G11]
MLPPLLSQTNPTLTILPNICMPLDSHILKSQPEQSSTLQIGKHISNRALVTTQTNPDPLQVRPQNGLPDVIDAEGSKDKTSSNRRTSAYEDCGVRLPDVKASETSRASSHMTETFIAKPSKHIHQRAKPIDASFRLGSKTRADFNSVEKFESEDLVTAKSLQPTGDDAEQMENNCVEHAGSLEDVCSPPPKTVSQSSFTGTHSELPIKISRRREHSASPTIPLTGSPSSVRRLSSILDLEFKPYFSLQFPDPTYKKLIYIIYEIDGLNFHGQRIALKSSPSTPRFLWKPQTYLNQGFIAPAPWPYSKQDDGNVLVAKMNFRNLVRLKQSTSERLSQA